MKNNNFEDQFREAFSMHEPNVSTEEIWKNVEPHLKKKKKRRFFFFWWLIGGLGLAFLGYGLKQWIPNHSFTTTEVVEASSKKESPVKKAVIASEEECPETDSGLTPSLTSGVKKSFVQTVLKEETKTFTPIAVNKKLVELPPSEIVREKKIGYSDSKIIDSKIAEPKDEITENKPLPNENDSKEKNQPERDLKDKKPEKIPMEKIEKEKTKKKKSKKKKKKKKKRIKPLRNKWQFHTQVVTGPVLPIRIMTSNRDEIFTNFRKDSENGVGGFTIGTNFIAQSPQGLVLSGGLEYIEFRERFRYETMDERIDISIGTVAVVENAEGEIIETINGPVTTTTTTTRKVRHTNKYRFFSVPVGIGKAWRNRKNYWRVYGGLDFNLAFSFNGKMFTEAFTTNASIREVNRRQNRTFYDSIYRRKAGIGLWLSTEYSRPITNQLSWMIAPRIKFPLSSITVPDYEINQRYIPISVQIGINYLLNPPKKKKQRVKEKLSSSF